MHRFAAGILLVLIGAAPVAAQTPDEVSTSIEGGRGLMSMQSARTYGMGVIVVGAKGLILQRETPMGNPFSSAGKWTDYPAVNAVPLVFGLTDEVDLSASFFSFNDTRSLMREFDAPGGYGSPSGGLGMTRASAKIRLPLSPRSRVQIAGSFAALIGTAPQRYTGMNDRWARTGTDIEASLYESFYPVPTLGLHFQQGYVLSGTDPYDDQLIGAMGIGVAVTGWMMASLEAYTLTYRGVGSASVYRAGPDPSRYRTLNGQSMVGDARYVLDDDLDVGKDLFVLTPSVTLKLNESVGIDVGVNINMNDDTPLRERYQVVAGISLRGMFHAMIDADGDGINNRLDIEPHTPRGYPVDARGVALDTDGDGVPDGIDREPATPGGVRVDASGVGIDSDGDGVFDGLDMEPDTPPGCEVNQFGIALDDDRDAVPNCLDSEPDTPAGAIVDEMGVGIDSDGDGVPNGLDMGPDTPSGAMVDATGVAVDGDGDGVPDGIDVEPTTPRGILVDRMGRGLISQEYSLLSGGMIRLNEIIYPLGGTEVPPEGVPVLEDIGRLLRQYPSMRIQVAGHTDRSGDAELNYDISRRRAQEVRELILTMFPEIGRDRIIAVGYGPDKPIASNTTEEGRRMNRRVEFIVINQE